MFSTTACIKGKFIRLISGWVRARTESSLHSYYNFFLNSLLIDSLVQYLSFVLLRHKTVIDYSGFSIISTIRLHFLQLIPNEVRETVSKRS